MKISEVIQSLVQSLAWDGDRELKISVAKRKDKFGGIVSERLVSIGLIRIVSEDPCIVIEEADIDTAPRKRF